MTCSRWLRAVIQLARAAIGRRSVVALVLASGLVASCRGRRAPTLPEPQDFSELIVLGIFVVGFGWLVLKILRG